MKEKNTNLPLVYYALQQVKPMERPIPPYTRSNSPVVLSFSNGTVEIPNENGGYIVSCGCGSGKTTNIQRIIKEKYLEGVLYCVDTKDELEKMKHRLITSGIAETSVLMIHGDIDKAEMSDYQKHPEKIVDVPVLLITHCRLFMDMISLFILYKPTYDVGNFDGDFEKLMKRPDTRKWLFLDETPLMFRPFCQIRHSLIGYFDVRSRKQAEQNYTKYIKGTKEDPFKSSTKLGENKKELVLNLIPKNIDKWKTTDRKKDLTIHFYTSDLVQEGMQSHVVVFEGAGDILLRTSGLFRLIDIKNKYNTKVYFEPFEFTPTRKDAGADWKSTVTKLSEIVKGHSGKVLVVVWKSVGNDRDDEDSGDSSFRDNIRKSLLEKGCSPEKFSVTYYGASNTKSTNEFRDFDGIILCGDWSISNDKAKQIDEAYMSATSPSDQKLWYFVQLVCRTAIRNHNGGEIRVWHSSDYSMKFIRRLDTYLNKNLLTDNENMTGTWIDKLTEMKIRKQIQEQIIKLNEFDSKIGDNILSGKTYKLRVGLDTMYELFPRKKKARREYKSLIESFRKVGIELEIP